MDPPNKDTPSATTTTMDEQLQKFLYGHGILSHPLIPMGIRSATALSEACVQLLENTSRRMVSPTIHQDQLEVLCTTLLGGSAPEYTEHNENGTTVSIAHPVVLSEDVVVVADTREAAAVAVLQSLRPTFRTDLVRLGCVSLETATAPLPFPVRCLLESFVWNKQTFSIQRWIVWMQVVVVPLLLEEQQQPNNNPNRWARALQTPLQDICDALERGTFFATIEDLTRAMERAAESATAGNEDDGGMTYYCRFLPELRGRLTPVRLEESGSANVVVVVEQVDPSHVPYLINSSGTTTVGGRSDWSLQHIYDATLDPTDWSHHTVTAVLVPMDQVHDDVLRQHPSRSCGTITPSLARIPISLDWIQVVPETGGMLSVSHGTGWCGRIVGQTIQQALGLDDIPLVVRVAIGATTGLLLAPEDEDDEDWDPQSIGIRPSMVQFATSCRDATRMLSLDILPLVPHHTLDQRPLLLLLQQLLGGDDESSSVWLQLQASMFSRWVAQECHDDVAAAANNTDYIEHHIVRGRKGNGAALTVAELSGIVAHQQQQTAFWGLPIAEVRVGIPDLYHVLDEGEIYLPQQGRSNTGTDVLMCRSTCFALGGLQTVRAIPESRAGPYAELDETTRGNVVILSTQGHRPLADMLVGLDMSANEYFTEPALVERAKGACVEPLASTGYYNTDVSSATTLDSTEWFASSPAATVVATDDEDRTTPVQRAIDRSALLSRTIQAWFAVADQCGAGHDETIHVEQLLQTVFAYEPSGTATGLEHVRAEVDQLLATYELPHWFSGGTRQSTSIIGKLHDQWHHWTKQLQQSMVQAERQESAGGVPQAVVTRAPLPTGAAYPQDMVLLNRLRASGALDLLIDVVFGRIAPASADGSPIQYRQLGTPELAKLVDLVVLDFKTEMDKEVRNARHRHGHQHGGLRPFDVYVNTRTKGGEILVCLRGRDGGLLFRTKSGTTFNATSVGERRRVASLTRAMRILESFATHPAPDSLMYAGMQRSGLVRVVEPNPTMDYNGLSKEQAKIVATVQSSQFKTGFLLLEGPPGSGKTRTILEVLKAVGSGVILVGPTNASVANLARTVANDGFVMAEDLLVWGENCDESVQFLNPQHRRKKFLSFETEYKALQDSTGKASRLEEFLSWLRLKNQDLSIQELSAFCQQRVSTAISGAKFLFCTINTVGAGQLREFGATSFHMLIMDDAGQCPEADFYTATTFPDISRILVVGDPMQLRAPLNSSLSQTAGLGKSFLENCLDHYPDSVHRLATQYRMDSRIVEFANESFYSRRIKTADLVSKRQSTNRPLRFVDMSGMSEEQRSGTSWKNEYDAAVIKTILVDDNEIRSLLQRNAGARVIVISPYDAQVQLLRKQLKQLKTVGELDIGTVDNFQGQEGDIVVVSLARTSSVQFSEKHRLNTAFTRAKLCLVVIGDLGYYRSVAARGSAIGNFAKFVDRHPKIVERASGDEAWYRPNWEGVNGGLWEATFTSKFHGCLKGLSWVDRNVALNTLLALATKSLSKLSPNAVDPDHLVWQRSSLRGYKGTLQIVWVPKSSETKGSHQPVAENAKHRIGYIDAHFAGSPRDCLAFVQNSRKLPPDACKVNRELTCIIWEADADSKREAKFDVSWSVTNELQHAILDDIVENLPTGEFVLDPEQEQIVSRPLPLLVESRSGTGKTNCLFCHALSHARAARSEQGAAKPICFVTVSQRLCEELTKRYVEAENMRLQYETSDGQDGNEAQTAADETRLVDFFSFRRFLGHLLKAFGVAMTVDETCSFPQFLTQRRSHQRLDVELHLVENEIGGAIMGSLESARNCRPLTREEYLKEIRSNIKKDEAGHSQRNKVYTVYEEYKQFKVEHGYYDEGDIVLKLVECVRQSQDGDVFQSLYLDEVQDFSFAAIYLMCHIAGKSTGSWCAAGDIAQMITPGCAFTFDGMKQTLRAVDETITLNKVASLLKNYRTSRGVLEVANAVLAKLKVHYPEAIDHIEKETAVKDLNLPVVILEWAKAKNYDGNLKLGVNQAVVYTSSRDSEKASQTLEDWVGHHPFILSSLDSKGLEFDDVIVYTKESPRKAWEPPRPECLTLLRELYVAITRAKERVVIVVAKGQKKFFESLDCPNIESADPNTVLVEFDKETDANEWYIRGKELFAEKKYELASGCFKSAGNFGWLSKARGFHLEGLGKTSEAQVSLRTAAAIFFDSNEYKECLDAFAALAKLKPWNPEDNELLDQAMEKEPNYLPRRSMLEFAVNRGSWNMVTVSDLCDAETSDIFRNMRGESALTDHIRLLSDTDIAQVGDSLPLIVGDIYVEQGKLKNAVETYLSAGEFKSADSTSDTALRLSDTDETVKIVSLWTRSEEGKRHLSTKGTRLARMVRLFVSPANAVKKDKRALRDFGARLVKRAVEGNQRRAEILHDFSRQEFKADILEEVTTRLDSDPVRILQWYTERGDEISAKAFVCENMDRCTNSQLLENPIFGWVANERSFADLLQSRDLLLKAVSICLTTARWDLELASKWSTIAIKDSTKPVWRETLQLWEPHKNDRRVRDWMSRGRNTPSGVLLLLLVVSEGTATLESHRHACVRDFGDNLNSIIEYIQRNEPRPAHPFQVGDFVEFQNLNTSALNGRRATVASSLARIFRDRSRIPVVIDNRTVVVLPEKLRKVADISDDGGFDSGGDDSSDDSIPPLSTRYHSADEQSSDESHGDSSSSSGGAPLRPRSSGVRVARNTAAPAANANRDTDSDDTSSDDEMPDLITRHQGNESDETTDDDEDKENSRAANRARYDSDDSSEDDQVWRRNRARRR